ncbi:MAG TPA: 2OG-Fe(II) oxygenase [Roseiarcus sp.]|nr:2OG-Fe(II) oxygenase [Roseiarcus sp.]
MAISGVNSGLARRAGVIGAVPEIRMTYCDFATLESAPLERDPFEYVVVPNFIRQEKFAAVVADYPEVPGPGSHPPAELDIRGQFAALIKELLGPEFRAAIERKFAIDLTGRPTMYTVRGFVREKDGAIHTDSTTKIITVLLYMNERWQEDAGRLRLLRGPDNLDDYVAEVPPYGGTLLVFKRADNSWHGHKPISGPRRAIQINWVTDQEVVEAEQRRHQVSTRFKKFKRFFTPGRAAASH